MDNCTENTIDYAYEKPYLLMEIREKRSLPTARNETLFRYLMKVMILFGSMFINMFLAIRKDRDG